MRVLLVSPGFHGYHSSIAAALAARGHEVATHVYDDHGGVVGRTWHQVRHQLPRRIGAGSLRRLAREETGRAAAAVARARPQAVVVVKGDTLGRQFWDAVGGLPRITWLYDEVRRTRWTADRLAGVGPLATYSALDDVDLEAAGLDSRHLPLAFDHRLVASPTPVRRQQVSFVGARYPTREDVLTLLHDHGVPVRAYGRDWSSHPVDRLRTWRVGTPAVPAGRDLTRAEAYDVMASSSATLNLHGDQDGFTMRTFEAAGVGAVELVDRTDVATLYEPGAEVLAFTTAEELVELCDRVVGDPSWSDPLRAAARARTLAEHTFDHRVAVLEASWDTV
ncbi:glycosyltransferase [Nocardioides sp. zg-1308]|uniref:glycosyltransferase family protein n=1 Tax=Nocardioides TaxID=1839 RepID=UPI001558234C|nr:glycosyltransferase [Nocardioides sp. S-34]NPD03918.1 glycosyltransferase [Nocardioides sp. zg-1308]WQQ21796.1 glycosyltransferase [Nocardioides sp. S-34]